MSQVFNWEAGGLKAPKSLAATGTLTPTDLLNVTFKGVYTFFEKIETGRLAVHLPELVLFQAYFVLTSFYRVPRPQAAGKLGGLVAFRGIRMAEKDIAVACLKRLEEKSLDLVDAYLLAWIENKGVSGVYSFDSDLATSEVDILPVK